MVVNLFKMNSWTLKITHFLVEPILPNPIWQGHTTPGATRAAERSWLCGFFVLLLLLVVVPVAATFRGDAEVVFSNWRWVKIEMVSG